MRRMEKLSLEDNEENWSYAQWLEYWADEIPRISTNIIASEKQLFEIARWHYAQVTDEKQKKALAKKDCRIGEEPKEILCKSSKGIGRFKKATRLSQSNQMTFNAYSLPMIMFGAITILFIYQGDVHRKMLSNSIRRRKPEAPDDNPWICLHGKNRLIRARF